MHKDFTHSLSITKATKSGGPISEGGLGQGPSAHRASQHTAAPADSRCHPGRFRRHLSGLLVAYKATVPFGEAWGAGLMKAPVLPPY